MTARELGADSSRAAQVSLITARAHHFDKHDTSTAATAAAAVCTGPPASDAWLGNLQIDPAKGKGHAADPARTRGRQDLFAVLQQHVLQENSSSGGSSSKTSAAGQDAWMGNRWVLWHLRRADAHLDEASIHADAVAAAAL